ATAHGQTTPLQPIFELIRAFFRIGAADSLSTVIDKVTGTLSPMGLSGHAALLLQFLGVQTEASPVSDVSLRRLRLLDAIEQIARTASQRTPAIIVLEDVHWLDEASKPLL